MSSNNIPSSPQEWSALYQEVQSSFFPRPNSVQMIVLWVVTFSGPIAGLLYLASGWRRLKVNGAWLVRIDKQGYIYPHTHLVIPVWAVLYTIVNFALCVSMHIDIETRLHTHTAMLSVALFPVLFAFGWTKIWAMAYAMPPSKFRLMQVNQKLGSPNAEHFGSRCIPVIPFNITIISGYAIPFGLTIPMMACIGRQAAHLISLWGDFDSAYSSITDQLSSPTAKFTGEIKALKTVEEMLLGGKAVEKDLRLFNDILIVLALFLLFGTLWTSSQILNALWYQVRILGKAVRRREYMQHEMIDQTRCLGSSSQSIIPCKREIILNHATFAKSRESTASTLSWSSWLPTLKHGTQVTAGLWGSGPFKQTDRELLDSKSNTLGSHYRVLRRYAVNTLWQALLMCGVTISYTTLLFMLSTNAFDSSHHKMTFPEMEIIVMEWVNITWNCGPGILLGFISCVVAFSPMPKVPHEPTESVTDESHEF